MSTWLKRIAVGLVLLLLLAVVGGYFFLNVIARHGLERSASYATGLNVSVDDVSIGVFSGSFRMNRLDLANPEQPPFRNDRFMGVNHMAASVGVRSLFREKVKIENVHIDGIALDIERHDGEKNHEVILDRLNKLTSGKEEDEPGDQKYMIKELLVKNITVSFTGYPGMNKTIHLADIRMSNLGSENNWMTRSRIAGILIREVFKQMLTNPDMIPGTMFEGLRNGLDELEGLGDVSVRFLGDITDGTGTVLKDLGGVGGDVGGAVKDFFTGEEAEEADPESDD